MILPETFYLILNPRGERARSRNALTITYLFAETTDKLDQLEGGRVDDIDA
jgi:hypothetical protein